jgi:hypothetical protein
MKPKLPANPNSICRNCTRKCKQPNSVSLLACPNYEAIPVQLEIKFPGLRKTRKKSLSI